MLAALFATLGVSTQGYGGLTQEEVAERSMPRTVHSLKGDKPVDLFALARRHVWLRFLVDTGYGSATYIEVRRPSRFVVLVSTTGLLIRD